MELLNETVLLETKSTLFNLLIREISQFLCYERLLNMTYVAYKKCIFFAKCNSGRIAIQWFHIKHYLDYQYTKFQPYTSRVQKMCVFARCATLVPRLTVMLRLQNFFFRGILQSNYRKMTMEWSFSYNFFCKIVLFYNTSHLKHSPILWTPIIVL